MKILYDNKIANISASVENPDYPFSSALLDSRLTRFGKTINVEDQEIKFSATITADYCVILAHNFTSSATVTLEGNDTDVWTSPSLSETFTAYGDSLVASFTSAEYDYWRIVISDATNPDGELSVGYIFLGTGLDMPGFNRPKVLGNRSNSIAQKSTSGQLYGDRRLNYKSAEITFPDVTETQRQEIKTFWNTVDVVQPFTLLIWEDDLNVEEPIYCSLTEELSWEQQDYEGLTWSLGLKFEEVF